MITDPFFFTVAIPAVLVMGVSKGGVATLNTAIAVRQRWRGGFPHLFDLHVAICPGATAQRADHQRIACELKQAAIGKR